MRTHSGWMFLLLSGALVLAGCGGEKLGLSSADATAGEQPGSESASPEPGRSRAIAPEDLDRAIQDLEWRLVERIKAADPGAATISFVDYAPGVPDSPSPSDERPVAAGSGAMESRLARIESDVAELTRLYRSRDAELASQITAQQDAIAVLESRDREIGQIVQSISERDAGGNYVPELLGNMQRSEEFRQKMEAAVHESLPRQGTLRVENHMTAGYSLSVNGTRYYCAPGEVRDIAVPVGNVTTELVGYEAPKHIAIAPPNLMQRLIIAPSASRETVVRRVVEEAAPNYEVVSLPQYVVW